MNSSRHLIENEVVFRQANQRAKKLAQSQVGAKTEKKEPTLHFYCECANENCGERIIIKPSKYQALHSNQKRFIVKPGHQIDGLEKTIKSTAKYSVVEKYQKPPKEASKLNPTSL